MTDITLTTDDATAAALIATIRAAVNGAGKYAAYVEAHNVERATVADHARALATLAYPNDKPVQKVDGKRTRFGNAVQAAGNGLRAALASTGPTPTARDYVKALIAAVNNASDKGNLDADEIQNIVESALYADRPTID